MATKILEFENGPLGDELKTRIEIFIKLYFNISLNGLFNIYNKIHYYIQRKNHYSMAMHVRDKHIGGLNLFLIKKCNCQS